MNGGTEQPERVVLVGRTGLEHDLRRESHVELGRARNALDAIGEFVEISETDDPRPATVVLGPGILAENDVTAFVQALRKIDENVRVVGMGDVNGAASVLDAVVPASASAAQLRQAMTGQHSAAVQAAEQVTPTVRMPEVSRIEPRPTAPPVPGAPASPIVHQISPAAAAPKLNDAGMDGAAFTTPVLAAILSGQDPVAAAVAEVSARFGVACKFAPGEAESLADAAASVRVSHSGRTLGWLRAPGVDRAVVEQEAARIAGWVLLAAQHDQLRRAAFTDELTGAFNRRYFNRFLAAAMEQARNKRHTVTLLVFDIDNFKTYNDRYSHSAGDEILTETVRLLTSVIRPSDRVCRVGGDEFAVIFHDPEGPRNPGVMPTTPQNIGQIAARFQKQICAHRFPKLLNEAPGTLTISGGMATFPWDGATTEELLSRADELAMQSKRQGKNAITFGPGAARVCQIDNGGETA